MVHILVAEALVSPRPGPEYEVNHIDFDRKNNDFSNLEWMTHSENVRHSVLHGRHVTSRDMSGENNFNYGNRKLSKFYAENPDVAIEKQSRPGAQNGKARAVRVYMDNDSVLDFDCIKQCAEYIIKVGRSKSSNANNLIPYISNAASRSVLYLGLRFEFI